MVAYKGGLLLYGGSDGTATLDETWIWDGTSWTNTGAAGPASGRTYAGLAAFNGEVVLFGGYDGTGAVVGGTWLWNGTSWTDTKAAGPSPRAAAVMIAR